MGIESTNKGESMNESRYWRERSTEINSWIASRFLKLRQIKNPDETMVELMNWAELQMDAEETSAILSSVKAHLKKKYSTKSLKAEQAGEE